MRSLRSFIDRPVCCRLCQQYYPNRRLLFEHKRLDHAIYGRGQGSGLQARPWSDDNNPFNLSKDPQSLLLEAEYKLHEAEILENHFITDSKSLLWQSFNFPLNNELTAEDIDYQLRYIFDKMTRAFKLNFGLGYLLSHKTTHEIRYWSPNLSSMVLQTPIHIKTRNDLEKAIAQIQAIDILQQIDRPNTSWQLKYLSNIKYLIFKRSMPIGQDSIELPLYILRNRAICTKCDNNKEFKISHNMCFLLH